MKIPKVIIHNSVSLDGAVTGFEVNMGLHYGLAAGYGANIHLTGSNTVRSGIEMFGVEIPPEEESDFIKPDKGDSLAYWVIPDTKGILRGMLHYLRRSEYCRDVVILISESTSGEYVGYLKERNYDYYVVGSGSVDFRRALEIINEKYNAETVMVDAGPTLNAVLLENGLADEINLIVTPYLVGGKSSALFSRLGLEKFNIELELLGCREVEKNHVLLSYRVLKGESK